MTTGAEALVEVLRLAGVRRVYGVPGEHCLDLVDEVGRNPEMTFVAARHESGAAYMAEAEAKLTGVPGVCLGTAGVGAANLAIGIHTARQDSTPLIALIGQVSTAWRHREAWQEIDLAAMFGPVAKWALEITHAARVTELASRAVQVARADRPGPVVIAVPEDVQRNESVPAPAVLPNAPRATLSGDDAADVIDAMMTATRPVLLLGGGFRGYRSADQLRALARITGARVVVGFRRHDSYPNDDPAFLGATGLGARRQVTEALREAELIVAVGTRLSELTTLRYSIPTPAQKFIHIDPSPDVLVNSHTAPSSAYVSDAEPAAQALATAASQAAAAASQAGAEPSHGVSVAADADRIQDSGVLAELATQLDALLDGDAIVTSDAGDFYVPFAQVIRYVDRRRYLGPTSGAMGYALPAAIAAALAEPSRQVVALAGDGGFMMSLPELETAVRLELNIVVIVVNNNSYGSIERHQREKFDGRLVGVNLRNPSFTELARVFGAHGRRVGADDAREALQEAFAQPGPALLEVVL